MKASEIIVVGLSHHTAPVDVRERLSVATEVMASRVSELVGSLPIDEGVIISTCNRVEIYGVARDPVRAAQEARAFLVAKGASDDVNKFLYERVGEEAVHHAFRVASSLDSMVIGEPQILGQVKSAVGVAESAGTVGPLLGQCFRHAFSVAKKVRTETEIAAGTVSVSSIAIELAQKIFGTLLHRKVLLVGAGKMGETAAKSLAKRGAELVVVNRSPDRAKELAAACGGQARPYESMTEELAHADVVITSTGSPTFIIGPETVRGVVKLRKGRPLFVIDIAVPRDVDPRVGELENVFLYDVDDLQKVAQENLALRRREADHAEAIVRKEVALFEQWHTSLSLTPTIIALRDQFHRVAREELERGLVKMPELGVTERQALEAVVGRVVNKLLHHPMTELKQGQDSAETALLVSAVRKLFALEGMATESLRPEMKTNVAQDLQPAPAAGGSSGTGRQGKDR